MAIRVECVADDRGEPLPVAMWLGERRLQVQAVVDRWFAPTRRWFRVALTRQAEPEVPVQLAARTPHATH
jgi:hypothetical protein